MKLVKPDIHPDKLSIVFALNSKGYLGIVLWSGENWLIPDCSKTKQVDAINNIPWIFGTFDNQQKAAIMNDIAYWIDFNDQPERASEKNPAICGMCGAPSQIERSGDNQK